MAKKIAAPIERLGYTPAEAAAALGMGEDLFRAEVLPHLRVVRVGAKRIVSTAELSRWLDEQAEAPIAEQVGRS